MLMLGFESLRLKLGRDVGCAYGLAYGFDPGAVDPGRGVRVGRGGIVVVGCE